MEQQIKPLKELANDVLNYITHSARVASASDNYKHNRSFMESLERCNEMKIWLSKCKGYYPTKDFCRMVVHNSGHLLNILPHPMNKSYNSSNEKINSVIEAVKLKLRLINN